jgi:ferredoxin
VIAAPTVFRLNETGDFAEVIQTSPPEQRWGEVQEAVRLCPTRAISVVDI